jgi:hypothetical protein
VEPLIGFEEFVGEKTLVKDMEARRRKPELDAPHPGVEIKAIHTHFLKHPQDSSVRWIP